MKVMEKEWKKIFRWSKHHTFVASGIVIIILAVVTTVTTIAFMGIPKTQFRSTVAVSPDANTDQIIETIHEHGFGGNTLFLKTALTIASLFKKIEAGGYYLSLAMNDWQIFRALANPGMRYITIAPGQRKQEIADVLASRLDWDTVAKREFVNVHMDLDEENLEGKYFPATYLLPTDSTPETVAETMINKYDEQIEKLKKKYPRVVVNYDTALLIASVIQREAAGKQDMRLISGIIWNRIFKGMSLSLDATVQYAKGKTEDGWWAPIEASDIREIDSPYNTYKNKGLPPSPISNPSTEAIEAALNPQITSCLYYLHDAYRRIHCSTTGEGHEANVRTYLR